jgi:diguanylate cyclase (GGDEF)-like protein
MIDIDHFKIYNDTYGHMQGDRLLQELAGVLTGPSKRATDVAARWGGEEFSVLLPNTDLNGAMKIAESIRSVIEETTFRCRDGTRTSITVSIGVNTKIPAIGEIVEDFIAVADKALYDAKDAGRNRVCFC